MIRHSKTVTRYLALVFACVLLPPAHSSEVAGNNLGVVGNTYEIAEPDSLAEIRKSAASLNTAKLTEEYEEKIRAFRPDTLPNLPGAQSDQVFTVDLTYTWNGPDISVPCEAAKMKVPAADELFERCRIAYGDDHAGKWILLYPSGYTFNPLDYIKVPYTYVVIDGTDEGQVEWFETTQYTDDVSTILLITNGSWYELSKHFVRPVFYADEKIIKRFRLKATPSVVRQSGNLMEVTEVAVKQEEDDKSEAH